MEKRAGSDICYSSMHSDSEQQMFANANLNCVSGVEGTKKTRGKRFTVGRFVLLAVVLMLFLLSTKAEAATTGWKVSNQKTYYYISGKKQTGLQKIGNYYFYFNTKGELQTGWQTLKGNKYYFAKTGTASKRKGRMLIGWHTLGGKIYYFKKTGSKYTYGKMLTGWRTLRNKNYYFNQKGQLLTGTQTIGSYVFYLRPSGGYWTKGSAYTGWRTVSGSKYYYRTSGKKGVKGAMYRNVTKKISGTTYKFSQTGVATAVKTTTATSTTTTKATSVANSNMSNSEFIAYIGKAARKDMKKTGVLASITVAQAILESAYGKSSLAMNSNNLFGMKASNTIYNSSAWSGAVYTSKTQEYINGAYITIYDKFRKYDSWEDSILDHSSYLLKAKNGTKLRYDGISTCTNYKKAIHIIYSGGYATAPDYEEKICNLIERYNLTQYDK